ncbi:MAG: DUF1273 domain-containing protein [Ruminococcaceae bacterium]|nr:DUF1273 domain-containing protein [Oscillospiraceae bacterium]
MKVCCFTGHRHIEKERQLPLMKALDRRLLLLAEGGVREFRAGGALGFDTLAALRVLFLKESRPEVRLSLVLPCRDQAKSWNERDRTLYGYILSRADEVRFLYDAYTPECMHARNRALVDGSHACVAYLTANRGGTLYTCSYALKRGVRLYNLADELNKV